MRQLWTLLLLMALVLSACNLSQDSNDEDTIEATETQIATQTSSPVMGTLNVTYRDDSLFAEWQVEDGRTIIINQESVLGSSLVYQYGASQGTVLIPVPSPLKLAGYVVIDANTGEQLTEAFVMNFACQNTWFVDTVDIPFCAQDPAQTYQGSYQAFERGFMVWDGQVSIWVFNEQDHEAWRFDDTWQSGVNFDANAPQGFVSPQRGFGTIWHNNQSIKDILGWALDYEVIDNMQYQSVRFKTGAHYVFSIPGDMTRVVSLTENNGTVEWR